jgi:hypothetical protein
MKTVIFAAAIAAALSAVATAQNVPFAVTKCEASAPALATIRIPQDALADGKRLTAGTYQVRITPERPAPAAGQSPSAGCWVEFVQKGSVVGREIATVISSDEIGAVAKGPGPKPGDQRVDVLKGGEYLRAWINREGVHYIVNLAVAREERP